MSPKVGLNQVIQNEMDIEVLKRLVAHIMVAVPMAKVSDEQWIKINAQVAEDTKKKYPDADINLHV